MANKKNESTTPCAVATCDRTQHTREFCWKHYQFFRKRGLFTTETCKEEGCDKPLWSRGLCGMHYRRVNDAERAQRAKENAILFADMRHASV